MFDTWEVLVGNHDHCDGLITVGMVLHFVIVILVQVMCYQIGKIGCYDIKILLMVIANQTDSLEGELCCLPSGLGRNDTDITQHSAT